MRAFAKRLRSARADMSSVSYEVDQSVKVVNAMLLALDRTTVAPGSNLGKEIREAKANLMGLQKAMEGSSAKGEIGERNNTSMGSRYFHANGGLATSYGPTPLHERSLKIVEDQLPGMKSQISEIIENTIPSLIQKLKDIGAPYIQGY